jgi:hypothetical protein
MLPTFKSRNKVLIFKDEKLKNIKKKKDEKLKPLRLKPSPQTPPYPQNISTKLR